MFLLILKQTFEQISEMTSHFMRLTPEFSPIGLQASFDADWEAGRITYESYRNGTEDGALAYKLLIQTGSKKEPFNYSQVCCDVISDV